MANVIPYGMDPNGRFRKMEAGDVLVDQGGTPAGAGGGKVAQVVSASVATVVNCTGQMPYDDTIPNQSTDGTEVLTVAITPQDAASVLRIEFYAPVVGFTGGAAGGAGAALFVDATANAIAAQINDLNGSATALTLVHEVSAGSTSARTYKIRCGNTDTEANVYINGNSAGTRIGGGIVTARLIVTEFLP